MIISRLRLITFDVTDTLLKFRSGPGHQYGEIAAIYGILCDRNILSANFKAHWRKMNQEHPNFGLYSGLGWEHWWKMVVKGTFKDSHFNLDDKKLDNVASHLIEIYKTSICWEQCHGVSELLSYIRSKGIPIGIISNFDPRLSTTLVNTRLRHYFQFVLTSYEVGVEKPDTKIFEEAMKASKLKNLKPEECLHIGDKTALDYLGARSSGWHGAVIIDRNPELLKEQYPVVETNHLFKDLFHLQKYFINSTREKLTGHSLY
ncbi:rhythmically expressed gene 2 protein [Anoplophora glabripennis]|nr:rhythmically expressed gene 2 protein [Anoplophora glabripennis]